VPVLRPWRRSMLGLAAVASCLASPAGAAGQADVGPGLMPITPCLALSVPKPPLRKADPVLTQAFANPNTAFGGRFHPGEDWGYAGNPSHVPVFAIGEGRVVHVGPIQPGPSGSVVVVEHAGPVSIPASKAGAPYSYPASTEGMVLSVYLHVDPDPAIAVGSCVTSQTQLGVTTAQCSATVTMPCSQFAPHLHFEVRLAGTADPARRTSDWSVAGAAADWSGGYFRSAQAMVDDGMREPSMFVSRASGHGVQPTHAPVDLSRYSRDALVAKGYQPMSLSAFKERLRANIDVILSHPPAAGVLDADDEVAYYYEWLHIRGDKVREPSVFDMGYGLRILVNQDLTNARLAASSGQPEVADAYLSNADAVRRLGQRYIDLKGAARRLAESNLYRGKKTNFLRDIDDPDRIDEAIDALILVDNAGSCAGAPHPLKECRRR